MPCTTGGRLMEECRGLLRECVSRFGDSETGFVQLLTPPHPPGTLPHAFWLVFLHLFRAFSLHLCPVRLVARLMEECRGLHRECVPRFCDRKRALSSC
ncbi:hypothetical protein PBY51_005660 [Eleginops maclovinus]|uniref:Uncharacterized protein n=1 Tax=Eleginops maclovinus TaxID=56733 RepID=A0AAN7WRR2_ELEMC|nr:hypothetical protein PBY51_005660 [Eleginops maclovinus]